MTKTNRFMLVPRSDHDTFHCMKALIQRVSTAKVWVEGNVIGKIGPGMVIFLGVRQEDTQQDAEELSRKIAKIRIFPDDQDRMNLSLSDIAGEALVISQFTLYANTRKGNRPSFITAASPAQAKALYDHFVYSMGLHLSPECIQTGRFRSSMQVELTNDGPVTFNLDTDTNTK